MVLISMSVGKSHERLCGPEKEVLAILRNNQYMIESCESLCRIFEETLGFYVGSNNCDK